MRRASCRSFLTTVVASGCGRIGFASVGDAADASTGIAVVAELAEAGVDVDDPSLTPDLLEIFYRHTVVGQEAEIYTATRMSTSVPFTDIHPVVELNSALSEGAPDISSDGLTIYFSSSRTAPPAHDIWVATRPTRTAMWNAPLAVTELNTTEYEIPGGVDDAGLRMIFSRSDPLPNANLFESSRASPTDVWGTPVRITELNTADDEGVPFLDKTGTKVYFASTRPGLGGRDLWFAERLTPTSTFTAPTPLTGLSSASSDEDPWVTTDGKLIYFASNRGGGRLAIYQATL